MSDSPNYMVVPVDILLVEDSALDAELTLRVLRKHNLANRVTWIQDGAEALEFILGAADDAAAPMVRLPKLILLDVKMPKMDGLEVLCRLKGDWRTRTVPVVMLTSSREDADIKRAYENGANSYIVKPVEFEAFVDAVTQVGMYWLLLNQRPDAAQQLEDDHGKRR